MEPPRHIVAVSGLVTDPLTGRILLIRSPRRGWEFPGGQVELGESLTEALVREVQEETGVMVEVRDLVGVYSNTHLSTVMFGFLCEWLEGKPTTSPESLEVAWVERDRALERVTNPAIYDRLRDMLDFDGTVVYRAYIRAKDTYLVEEERTI